MIKNLFNCIYLGWYLFLRDFQYRYRQTYFGYLWAIVKPCLMVLPIIIVGRQFNMGQGINPKVPYEAFSFIGLILWQIFWDAVITPQWIIRRLRRIIKSIYIWHVAPLFAAFFYQLFYFIMYSILVTIVINIFKVQLQTTYLYVFFSIPFVFLAGFTIGMFIAPIILIYLDIRYALPILSGLLLWMTPIAYIRPQTGLLAIINKYNPLTYLIGIPRNWLLVGVENTEKQIFFFLIVAIFFIFFISLNFYKRSVPKLIEYIL